MGVDASWPAGGGGGIWGGLPARLPVAAVVY